MLEHPLEYALIEFQGNTFSGRIVPELLDLAERDIVRFVDIVFISKDDDGGVTTIELNDLDAELYSAFVPVGEHVASLFTQDDLAKAASKLDTNTSAALLLWENVWSDNIRRAIAADGGRLVERGQIPGETVEQFKRDLAAQS
jgi:Family of unknown function (DUF6325)